jgi:5-methyltetrahydrofolate--homocysteine methyltransferase
LRSEHAERHSARQLLPIAEARANRLKIEWDRCHIAVPGFTGIRTLDNVPLKEIVPFIDWTPFFQAWELHGRYPDILADTLVGERAGELWRDARLLLDDILRNNSISAKAVYGFFPANSVGDDIELYGDESRSIPAAKIHTLRQQAAKSNGLPNQALADFVAPKGEGWSDYIGAFALSAGFGVDELCRQFEADHDDYRSIMTKALADRLAEGFAEFLHKKVREEWGYGSEEKLHIEDLIRERYRGIRPAPGYPACPDHTEKRILFDLLEVENRVGICLTESFAMLPASSVSGYYFAHPESRYFAVGKIGRDQVEDYAQRKQMDRITVERWLAPNLSYTPE